MLIGIHGKAGAGKDTLADIFVKEYGYEKYSFAKPLKDAVKAIFGWDERHVNGELKEVNDPFYGFSPRHAMQTLGTEWGRVCLRNDLWTRIAQQIIYKKENIVIPDVRFDNEAEFILENKGLLLHVVRPSQETIGLSAHASERGITDIDKIAQRVINDGSISKLQIEAFEIIMRDKSWKN